MRKIRLYLKSFKGNIASTIILLIVLTAVLVLLNNSFSQYLFINRAGELFNNGNFSNGVHFINTTPFDTESFSALKNQVKSLEEYDYIQKIIIPIIASVNLNGEAYQLELYDEDIYPKMYGTLPIGEWKSKEGEMYCAVVGGVLPKDVPVGETVELINNNFSYELKISGAIAYPPLVFDPSYYASINLTANHFFTHKKVIYLPQNDETLKIIKQFNNNSTDLVTNGIVLFTDDATEEQKKHVINLLSPYSKVTLTDTIIKDTNEYVENSLKEFLPLPIFIILVSSLSYISIAVLNINKKKGEYTIYHIVGCNKRTMTTLSILQVSTSLVLSTISICVATLVLRNLAAKGIYSLPNLIFGWQNIVLTCTLSAILLSIVVLISTSMLKRFSPIEQLRLVKE